MKLPKIIDGDFEPHFSVKHMLKDLQLAAKIARTLDLDLAMNEAVRDALIEEVKQGRADDDYSSIAHRYLPEGVPVDMPSEPPMQPDLIIDFPTSDDPEPTEMSVSDSLAPAIEGGEELAIAQDRYQQEEVSQGPSFPNEEERTIESLSPPPESATTEDLPQETNDAVPAAPESPAEKEEPEERKSLWSRLISRGGDY